jgi:hypothetical protein
VAAAGAEPADHGHAEAALAGLTRWRKALAERFEKNQLSLLFCIFHACGNRAASSASL